jgi:RNA polymerase sigma-70 factor (ECF subfamily)
VNALPSEADLIGRALAGDEAAFCSLLGPLILPAYQLAATMLRDREDARDVVQNASFKAWRKLAQLREGMPLRPWFLAIVANESRELRRSRWLSVLRLSDPPVAKNEYEDSIVVGTDLGAAIRRLHSNERLALFLYFYLDMPIDEVAQVLGMKSPAVKSRIYRAVHKLRLVLSKGDVCS